MTDINKVPAGPTNPGTEIPGDGDQAAALSRKKSLESPAIGRGSSCDYRDNRFVYLNVSSQARGLSVGVNLNPDKVCNFDCVYCNVERRAVYPKPTLDVRVMAAELESTLAFVLEGQIRSQPAYQGLPAELLQLRHVALSGDGEPTISPCFCDAVESVAHIRAKGTFPFFKIVLLTNGSGLDAPEVQRSLKLFTSADEVWIKLDAGTQAYMNEVNRPQVTLKKVLANILLLGLERPVIIQSVFSLINGRQPSSAELDEYVERLKELRTDGAKISLVKVFSPNRPMAQAGCGHLPLKNLSDIARLIRSKTGLIAEVV